MVFFFSNYFESKIFKIFAIKRAFDVDLLYIAEHFKLKIYEININWHEVDGSKITIGSWFQMGKDLLSIRLHYLFGAWKLNPNLRIAD
jgi:dolichyl-phosphate beta-glucosyltransferase